MDDNKQKTEEQILIAAEQIFLSKGYAASNIKDIAKLAKVNNALINYYFRSKENLFNKVLNNKIRLLANAVTIVVTQDKPFLEIITNFIETQFDFFAENEMLPRFILSEIMINEQRIELFKKEIAPAFLPLVVQLNNLLQKEIEKGAVRKIHIFDLLYTVASLNVFSFLVKPVIVKANEKSMLGNFDNILKNRKQKNIDVVISYLNGENNHEFIKTIIP
jgi:AcrR family transcriptional regulator